jgi:hypothetical protein
MKMGAWGDNASCGQQESCFNQGNRAGPGDSCSQELLVDKL